MDRLSNLPKHILDNILSWLPEEDIVRTSVLSKAWKDTWSTCPVLRFSQQKYVNGLGVFPPHTNEMTSTAETERKRNSFADFVEKKVTRFHDQCLAIHEFKLYMYYSESMYPRIDHWMRLVAESGTVQVLDLMLMHDKARLQYCFPASILLSRSLTKLILRNGKLDHAWVNYPIAFSSLQQLSLISVTMSDQQIIQNIMSSCPSIEYLTLTSCRLEGQNDLRLKSLRIHGLHKLKSVVALEVHGIDIDAAILELLHFAPPFGVALFKTNLDKCRNLKKLRLPYLRNTVISNQWFLELFLKFPLLKRLELPCSCSFSGNIRVSSVHLKALELCDHLYSNLKALEIDAPKLCLFKYKAFVEMPTLIFNRSSQLQVDLSIYFICNWDLQKLRQLIQGFEDRSIQASLFSNIYWRANEFNLDVLPDLSVLPPRIKHLNLWISPQLHTSLLLIISGLLYCCCPDTISVRRDDKLSDSVIEAFCNVLNHKEHDECYCSSRDIKYWWHSLKDVQITRIVDEVYNNISTQLK